MATPFSRRSFDAAWTFVGGLSIVAIVLASARFASDVGDSQTRNMIRLSLVWYFAALVLMMALAKSDWLASAPLGRAARWCWTWAMVYFLIHVTMAFHYFHHWSHADAVRHTREVSGFGEGVYISYLFTLLWIVDVAYWWLAPRRYAERSAWIDRGWHGFMLFMVFNGTVVYESGPIRCAGLLMFTSLAAVWLVLRTRTGRNAIPVRSIVLLLAAAGIGTCGPAQGDEGTASQPATKPLDFERQVAPILLRRCSGCHNPNENAGKLNLLTLESAQAGGKSGEPAIKPGDIDNSYAITRIEAGEMPPPDKAKPVGLSELAVLKKWIDSGRCLAQGPGVRSDGHDDRHSRRSRLVVAPAASSPRCAESAKRIVDSHADRRVRSREARAAWPATFARSRSGHANSPRDARRARASAVAGRSASVCRRRIAGCLRTAGGPLARFASLRRMLGAPLAGRSAIRRKQRL